MRKRVKTLKFNQNQFSTSKCIGALQAAELHKTFKSERENLVCKQGNIGYSKLGHKAVSECCGRRDVISIRLIPHLHSFSLSRNKVSRKKGVRILAHRSEKWKNMEYKMTMCKVSKMDKFHRKTLLRHAAVPRLSFSTMILPPTSQRLNDTHIKEFFGLFQWCIS